MIAQLELPTESTDTEVTIDRDALVRRSDELARMGCFKEAMWYAELSDAARLDMCPLRMSRLLAERLGLRP